MSTTRTLSLLSSAFVAGCLVAARPWPANAQADPAAAPASQPQPPAVVGRIAIIQGTVSFRTADEQQWQPATLNYPLTSGDALWTEPQALAEIQVAASAVWLNGGTELDVNALDDHSMATTEPQGELFLHLRNRAQGQSYRVTTPRGVVTLNQDGRYDIVAGDTEHPTTVSVVEGAAQVTANNLTLQIGTDQTGTINGTETFQGSVGPLAQDAFLARMEAREQRALKTAQVRPPAIVNGMTGCQTLSSYGTWTANPQYGAVWYPEVGADWTPYQDGSWDYVAPWGWTWVSAELWGFAPFHYGRWSRIDGRWAWVPGAYNQNAAAALAVYAPALVSFFTLGSGEVGWVPLAPGEAYYPPYRADDRYLRALNRFDVRDAAALRRDEQHEPAALGRLANRGAAIVVPAAVVTDSRPVRDAAHRLQGEQMGEAHPLPGREPIRPTLATAGITPRVAREERLEGEARRIALAPGPRIERPRVTDAHRLPPLRPANIPPVAPGTEARRPGEAERHPAEAAPAGGLPALREPNARPGGRFTAGPGAPPPLREHGVAPAGGRSQPTVAPGATLPVPRPPRHEAMIQPGPRPGAPPPAVRRVLPPVMTPRFAPPQPRVRAGPIVVRPAVPPIRVAPPRLHFAPPARVFAPPPSHAAAAPPHPALLGAPLLGRP
jgi:hypothetical protein